MRKFSQSVNIVWRVNQNAYRSNYSTSFPGHLLSTVILYHVVWWLLVSLHTFTHSSGNILEYYTVIQLYQTASDHLCVARATHLAPPCCRKWQRCWQCKQSVGWVHQCGVSMHYAPGSGSELLCRLQSKTESKTNSGPKIHHFNTEMSGTGTGQHWPGLQVSLYSLAPTTGLHSTSMEVLV